MISLTHCIVGVCVCVCLSLLQVNMYSSVFSLTWMSLDRCMALTHLLAAPVLLLRCWALLSGHGRTLLDVSALPLALYLLSTLTYLACSVAAHLLQSHSELAHYSIFFLDSSPLASTP